MKIVIWIIVGIFIGMIVICRPLMIEQQKQNKELRERLYICDSINEINTAKFKEYENSYDPAENIFKKHLEDSE